MNPRSSIVSTLAALVATGALVAGAAGCPQPQLPNADLTAKYLGLAAGNVATYAVDGGVPEKHVVAASSLLPSKDNAGGLVLDQAATSGNFQVDERTLTFELSPEDARIVRFDRCTPQCGQPSAPIVMFDVPLKAGASKETEVDVAVTDAQGAQSTVHEKHTFVVGDQAGFTVPAGDFQAFTVTWTRSRGAAGSDASDVATATLRIAPDTGIVAWDGFDGQSLKLQ